MISLPKKIISYLENSEFPFLNYLITFFAIVLIRGFLESYSQETNYFNLPSLALLINMVHYALCYVAIAMLISSVFLLATASSVESVLRIVLASFALILLAPCLDLVLTQGHGTTIMYFQPELVVDFVSAYFAIGGDYKGISLGMRIELVIAMLAFFCYFRVKNLNFIISLFYSWLCYSLIFFIAALPYFLKWLADMSHVAFHFSSLLMIHFYLIFIFIFSMPMFYMWNKAYFLALFSNLKWQRFIHYFLLCLFGWILGIKSSSLSITDYLRLSQVNMADIFLCLMSIFFLFAALTSFAIPDYENEGRIAGKIFAFLAIFYLLFVNIKAMFVLGLIEAILYTYYRLPLKINRLLFISTLVLSFIGIALCTLGYLIAVNHVYGFPSLIYWVFLTAYFVAANIIDIAENNGKITLFTVLGPKAAKILIGVAAWEIAIAFFYFTYSYYFLLMAIAMGGIQYYLINKSIYNENIVLGFSNGCFLLLMSYLQLH